MKKNTFFVILFFSLTPIALGRYCATPKDDTLYIYPSANNCSMFIVCLHNEEIEMSCLQASLFMFTKKRVCMDECAIETTTRRMKAKSYEFTLDYDVFPALDSPHRTILCPLKGSTRAFIPHTCDEYIECVDGVGSRMSCDNGTKFSPTKYDCVPDKESNCSMKKVKGSPNKKCRFEKGKASVVFPSEKCSEFKKCSNLMSWTIQCAQFTRFNKMTKSCEWENEVNCE
jgi:hypothetical protein